MREKILKFIPLVQSFIFKSLCLGCKNLCNFSICPHCIENTPLDNKTALQTYQDVEFYAAFKYENHVRKAIHALKFYKKRYVSCDLSLLLYYYWKNLDIAKEGYILVPVPIHKNKQKERGFNQMDLIGSKFAFLNGYKFNNKILSRIKDTKPQYNLNIYSRKKNIHGSFKVNKKPDEPGKILLIDDIFTTGATLSEAVTTLKENNIKDITVLALSFVDLEKFDIYYR